jgi:predicted outer membrane repeat protein
MITIFIFPLARISEASEVQRGERPDIDLTQVPDDAIIPGRIQIKFNEEYADFLDENDIYYEDGIALFGIPELDELNIQYEVTNIKILFDSPALKKEYEWRRRLWGFHLWYQLEFDVSNDIVDMVFDYRDMNELEWAEPEYKKELHRWIPDDPDFGNQWHYHNTGQTGGTPGADISLPNAWEIEKGNPNVIVAIIDGGIQYDHPDIQANMWYDVDHPYGGYNFVNDSPVINPHPHGTHVAGTVAAVTNNNEGVAGIAGGSGNDDGVRLMSCQIFGDGTGGFHLAPIFAAEHDAAISQNSWGWNAPEIHEHAILDAIDHFNTYGGGDALDGGISFFAAGNSGSEGLYFPAMYSGAFSVAATNHNDVKASYSTYDDNVDISAPGGETSPDSAGVYSTTINNNYAFAAGTSMACPHVSGIAALIVSYEFGNLSDEQVKNIIKITADDHYGVNPEYVGKLGSGRVNAANALSYFVDPTVFLSGNVFLDGGNGEITDAEINIVNNNNIFTINPETNGFYYKYFEPDEYGVYDIVYSLSGPYGEYESVTIENVPIDDQNTLIVMPDIYLEPVVPEQITIQGMIDLDGGTGDVREVEITIESDDFTFIVYPDQTGFYSMTFNPIEYGIYDISYMLYDESGYYYPVSIYEISVEYTPLIELDITMTPISSEVHVNSDPTYSAAFNNIQDALDHHNLIGNGGSVLIHSGNYTGERNRNLNIPYSNDPNSSFSIEITNYLDRSVIVDCSDINGSLYPGFIFDDAEYGTITEEYIISNITIKNGAPGLKVINGSPQIESVNFIDCEIQYSSNHDTYGAAIYSEGSPVINNNYFKNCEAKMPSQQHSNSVSHGGAIALHNSNGAIIRKNLFEENRAARGGAISVTESTNITISSNELMGNTYSSPSLPPPPSYPDYHPDSDGLAVYIEAVDSLYFDYNLIYLNGDNIQDNNNVVSIINADNVDFINNTVIDHEDHYALHIENVDPINIINTILYDNYASFSGDIPETSYSLIDEQPYLDDDYIPIWNTLMFSPAIDAGDPDLPWDPDDTPPDIGALRTIEHDFHITTAPIEEPDRYLWRSFPVMDRIYNAGEEVLYVLEPVEEQTDYFKIFYEENNQLLYEVIWQNPDWDPVEFQYFDSVQGYKIESGDHFSIPNSGFNQDYDTVIELDAGMNWVGYFIEETLSIDVALNGIWEYLEAVYSEDWAWEADDPYAIDPSRCTMIYGKMYKIVVSEPCELIYNTSEPVPPNERTMTDGFYYTETPMYSVIMIDEIEDPEAIEIGVYQDDVCIGATQIEEEPVQILAFPQNSSRGGSGNIHFELYYGQRSENKRIREFTVRESQGSLSSAKLSLAPYKFNYVTLDTEPDEPITQLTTTNYPNPFNPETTISYSLPSETHVEITIFNIRGQVVRRLVDGEQPAGRYQTVWNGKNDNGRSVGSGVYFYRITTDDKTLREKMLLLK